MDLLLEEDHAVVERDRTDFCLRKVSSLWHSTQEIPMMHAVDYILSELHETVSTVEPSTILPPIGSVGILYYVEATISEHRKQAFETCPLVVIPMAAVIENDVEAAHLVHDRTEEVAIVLRADPNLDAFDGEVCASRIPVDTVNSGVSVEVVAPKLK